MDNETKEKIKEAENQKVVFSSISGATGGAALGFALGGLLGSIVGVVVGGTFSGITEYKTQHPDSKNRKAISEKI
jgi:uncharacterized membrane protein